MIDYWWQAPGAGISTYAICPHAGLYSTCPACTMPRSAWPSPAVQAGWQCACGRVFNPQVQQCPHCGPKPAVPAEDFTSAQAVVELPAPVAYGEISDLCVPPSEGGLCDHDEEPQQCTGGRHCAC